MISSTHLTQSPLAPQTSRSAANLARTPSTGAYAPSNRVQFGDKAAKPSAWERFKQGVARLWQSFIAPFKSLLSWFKTPQAKLNADTKPSPAATPSKSTDPAGAQNPTETTAATEKPPIDSAAPGVVQGSPQPAPQSRRSKSNRTNNSRRPGRSQPEAPSAMHSAISQQNGTARPIQPTVNQQSSSTQSPQRSEPARPSITDNQASPTPTPGVGARLKSAFAWLRPQPTATQRHQQTLNELQEMMGEPETPPPAPPKKQTKKSSGQNIPARVRPAAASSGPVASTASLPRVIPVEELFGSDLTSIQFKQSGAYTCYLLSALDNIFQHPQGQKILDLIKVKQIENGYEVEFPGQRHPITGQPRPITVHHDELGQYVQSKTPGVAIIERAYLKIPGAKPPDVFDSTHSALIRMFGEDRVSQPNFQETTLAASAQMQPLVDEFAELWTATRRIVETGKPPRIGEHYYSLRLHPQNPNKIDLVNPYATEWVEQTLTEAQMEEGFWPEMNRIRLGD